MTLRKIPFAAGEVYHIYNRGHSKQIIFRGEDEYERFIKRLFLSNGKENFKICLTGNDVYNFNRGERLVDVGAYCLMPNHFHLLLTQPEGGGISKFMQKLSTGYSMYYNNKYERTGTLFEGKFKSEHAKDDRYLKYLFSYIHLNPVKLLEPNWKEEGIKNKKQTLRFIEQYKFSSYQDYFDCDRKQKNILNPNAFPDYFSTKKLLKGEIFNWLHYKK